MSRGALLCQFSCQRNCPFYFSLYILSPLLASRGVPATTIAILSNGSRSYATDSSEQKEMVQEQERKGEEEGGDDGSVLLLWLMVAVYLTNHAHITAFFNIQELLTI